jgi:acetoin utilization deacetylase AcuC-like enzyme
MRKYRRLRERALGEGILAPADLHVPDAASWDELALVHDQAYLDALIGGRLSLEAQRRIGFPWSPEMVERSRRSVGATLAAARAALKDGGIGVNLAGGTHHAFPGFGASYCVFNDVAVAVRVLQRDRAITRAAIIDRDVHQGDGTAAVFRGDTSVYTLSLHGAANFPFRKEASDLDVAFADGTGDEAYLDALNRHVPQVLDCHMPEIVFYLAGADPYEGDRLGRLKLSIEGLAVRDGTVLAACRSRGIPVSVTMSGGYATDIEAIVTIHLNTVRAALGILARDPEGHEPAAMARPPSAPLPPQ